MDEKTGYAVITPNRTLKIRLANEASVYPAQLSAISQALSLIKKETEVRWAIFSGSLSSLQAIESMYLKSNPILTEIQNEFAEIGEMETVKFVWTPGHAWISGNEKADEGAKTIPLRQYLTSQLTVVAADMITRAKFNAKKKLSNKLANNPRAPWLVVKKLLRDGNQMWSWTDINR
jgi:ribonuclease HI